MKRDTSLRQAFLNAAVRAVNGKGAQQQRSIIERVATNADVGLGIVTERDWNARLSMRTFKELHAKGVMV